MLGRRIEVLEWRAAQKALLLLLLLLAQLKRKKNLIA